jgi:hypothetical protein
VLDQIDCSDEEQARGLSEALLVAIQTARKAEQATTAARKRADAAVEQARHLKRDLTDLRRQ